MFKSHLWPLVTTSAWLRSTNRERPREREREREREKEIEWYRRPPGKDAEITTSGNLERPMPTSFRVRVQLMYIDSSLSTIESTVFIHDVGMPTLDLNTLLLADGTRNCCSPYTCSKQADRPDVETIIIACRCCCGRRCLSTHCLPVGHNNSARWVIGQQWTR